MVIVPSQGWEGALAMEGITKMNIWKGLECIGSQIGYRNKAISG